jgi:H+/Cl- antiporter ClcA
MTRFKYYRAKSYPHFAVWISATGVGACAIGYARLIAKTQELYFKQFSDHPYWVAASAPVFFYLATALVQYLAPDAKGSGIPQVIEAIERAEECESGEDREKVWNSSLVSVRTALVKVLSTLFGILGGASIGREGPTVQLASSGFAYIGKKFSRKIPEINPETFLTAGAAAGVAAAFNTPLAGITFALEEIAETSFALFKETVLISVIVAGVVAQAIAGDYLYFGHPVTGPSTWAIVPEAAMIGLIGGTLGGLFAKLISDLSLLRLPRHWALRSVICGAICAVFILITHGNSAGSGYEVARKGMEGPGPDLSSSLSLAFPLIKLMATALSYLSGMAGGIFSPCLSVGATIGFSVAKICHFVDFKACALFGMVAFFSGAVRAPLTAVIIVMEMTDKHELIFPFMIAALIGQGLGKLFLPVPLYRFLAEKNRAG